MAACGLSGVSSLNHIITVQELDWVINIAGKTSSFDHYKLNDFIDIFIPLFVLIDH